MTFAPTCTKPRSPLSAYTTGFMTQLSNSPHESRHGPQQPAQQLRRPDGPEG